MMMTMTIAAMLEPGDNNKDSSAVLESLKIFYRKYDRGIGKASRTNSAVF